MKLGGNLTPGYDALLFSTGGTGSIIWPAAQARLDIPRPLPRTLGGCGWSQSLYCCCLLTSEIRSEMGIGGGTVV